MATLCPPGRPAAVPVCALCGDQGGTPLSQILVLAARVDLLAPCLFCERGSIWWVGGKAGLW